MMSQRHSRRTVLGGLAAIGCLCLSGCSLFLMGQKMIFGDPQLKAEYKAFTHVDLTKGKHTLLIVCKTPEAVDQELSTLSLDVIDGVTRQLKREGIKVVDPDEVALWLDEHGGMPKDVSELARDEKLKTDYIAVIDVQEFSYHEEHSVGLLRGRARGFLKVYRVSELDDDRMAAEVFTKEFTTVYPPHQPISEVSRSSDIFRRDFIHRVCDQLAHKFYDHHAGWDI
jgi:hypothetical protein